MAEQNKNSKNYASVVKQVTQEMTNPKTNPVPQTKGEPPETKPLTITRGKGPWMIGG